MKVFRILPVLLSLFIIPSYASAKPAVNFNKPSYWVEKLKSPDDVVLSDAEITSLNDKIIEQTEQMADLSFMPDAVFGEDLLYWMRFDPIPEKGVKRYNAKGKRLKDEFFTAILDNMDLDSVNEINSVRFGVITSRADVRAFPTDEEVLRRPGSLEFDTFQYSSMAPPEMVVLLHTSKDGKWGFFQTGTVRGWIRLDKVAFGEREDIIGSPDDRLLVVTGSHVKVYEDNTHKKVLETVPMGTVLTLADTEEETADKVVWFPKRSPEGEVIWIEAYIDKKADVNDGYLTYTKKNVITQAFKMLGEEYGWGGKDGKRDCSEFIKDLFATMGIKLPRNSAQQGLSGDVIASIYGYDRKELTEALKDAEPGITLLTLKRHVMLHIGDVKGKPYVIHQIFGYSEGRKFKKLNKVAVTGLDIGKRSKAGPFSQRLRSITKILVPQKGADATFSF